MLRGLENHKRIIGVLLIILPLLVAAIAVGYWIYIWTYSGIALPAFKPLLLKLEVSNTTTTSINGNVNITTSVNNAIGIKLSVKYPYPWELLGQPSPYYYYYTPYYSYYTGQWYPTSYSYYYGYYYAFQAPLTLEFRYILAIRGIEGEYSGILVRMDSSTESLMMGEEKTVVSTSEVMKATGLYDVVAFAWSDYIHSIGTSWASLADPVKTYVEVSG